MLMTNPAVGLTVLKGLRGWEQSSACSDIWRMSQWFKAWDWAGLAKVGYTGAGNLRSRSDLWFSSTYGVRVCVCVVCMRVYLL